VTERQQLLGILALVYLSECVRWVRRGGVLFNAAPDLRVWRKSPLLHNQRGDAYAAWPLPPFGEFHVARGFPFSAGEHGILTFTAGTLHTDGRPSQPAQWIPWTLLTETTAENENLMANGRAFWLADTPVEAGRLAQELRSVAALSPEQRVAWMEKICKTSFDEVAIRSRLDVNRARLKPLRQVGSLLWLMLFAVLPAAVWKWGWTPTLWWGLPIVFAASAWTGWQTAKIHREWFPYAAHDRFRLMLLTGLSPVTAIRAADLLGRPRFEEFQPAAFALACLPKETASALCAALWRDLMHPCLPLPEMGGAAAAVEQSWRSRLLSAFRDCARRNGLNPDEWDAAPAASDASHTRYCPRCHSQSTVQATTCTECGGLPLRELASKRP